MSHQHGSTSSPSPMTANETAKQEKKSQVFISYKRAVDITYFARQLKRDLEANGYSVWLDMESIPSGSDWHGAIGTGLQECTAIIPIITQGYIESRFCMNELYTADSDKKLIFPIMYEDVNLVSTEGGRALKFIVSGINWTMFRPGQDDYSESLQKLIKGIKEKEKEAAQRATVGIQKAEQAEEESVVMAVGPASTEPLKMISGIQYPTHIATGQNGEIVVASYMSHKVHVYGQDYQLLRTFGSNGFMDGQFMCPSGIAVDKYNRIYVSSMSKVDVFTIEGQFLNAVGQQGNGPLQFCNAAGIAVGKEGEIYVADAQNHRIQVLNSDLTYRTSFSEACKVLGSGQLNQPQAIAINSEGNLYVADMMNHAVQAFSPDGKFLLRFGKYGPATTPGSTCTPAAIAIDRQDNVYVGSVTGIISIFDKEGTFLRQFGSYGSELGQFSQIKGMHIDRKGHLYVCEWTVNRIQIFPGSPSMAGPEEDGDTLTLESEIENLGLSKPAYLIGPKSSQPSKILSGVKEASGVAVGKNGEVVVGSWKDHKVLVYDSRNDYQLIAEVGKKGDEDGTFYYPSGVAVSSENHIVVTSYHKLQWFTMEGNLIHVVGSHGNETMQFDNPSAITIGKDGYIYILDSNNKRVQIFSGDATYRSSFGFPRLPDDDEDSSAKFSALAVNSEGNLYVTESGKSRVHVLTSSGEPLFKFGKSGSWMERGVLVTPMAIAIDTEDNVFVASTMMISIFDKSGTYIRAFGGLGAGDDPGQFSYIRGVHIDQHGWLYVSEYNNHRVQIFEGPEPSQPNTEDSQTPTKAIATLSSQKPAYMIGPTSTLPFKVLSNVGTACGIAEGRNGEVVVASWSENKVLVYSPKDDYQLVAEIGEKGDLDGKFIYPHGVAVTADNLILVTSQHKLQWFTMEGKLVLAVGGKGTEKMKFDHPTGIAVSKDGLIYVINERNKRVDILNSDGAYNGCFKFSHLTSDKDSSPSDVAINSKGNLYFTDSKNSCVHVYSPEGEHLFKFGKSGSQMIRGALASPRAIAIDTEDNVFVGDQFRVSIFDRSGSFIRAFGGVGEEPGKFSCVRGLCIGKSGHILVSQFNNSRVQIFEGNKSSDSKERAVPENPTRGLSSHRPVYTIGPSSDKPVKIISNILEPWGVATSPKGNKLFVVSKKGKKVLIYGGPDLELRGEMDKLYWETSRDNEVVDPRGIAVCEDGCLLLTLKNQLVKTSVDGEVVASVGKKGRRGKDEDLLDSPNGVALGIDGKVFTVDSGNSRVQVYDPNLSYSNTGQLPDSLEKSPDLEKAAVNSQGSVYVTDKRNNCIHVFNSNGKFLFSFGKKGRSKDRGALSSPVAIAIDHEDFVYISSSDNKVSIFDREGSFVRAFGARGNEPGQFRDIKAMHIDHKGNLYVCENGNNRVQVFAGIKSRDQGEKDRETFFGQEESKLDTVLPVTVLPGGIPDPCGITEGKNGEIVVASSSDHEVFVYDSNCTLLWQFGGKSDIDGQFNHPTSVAVTSDSYILVSSQDKLQWFTMQGQLVYALGNSGKEDLEFNHPDSMALGKDGRIYVLEKRNKRVQILNGNGTLHNSFGLKLDHPPEALAVNSEGIVFFIDTRSSCIERYSSDGTYLSRFNCVDSKEPALPTAIAIDTEDNIYVGTANGIVVVFDKEGSFLSAFRGCGSPGQFSIIQGLHMGQSGRVYVSDGSHNQVQVLGEARAPTPIKAPSEAVPSAPPLSTVQAQAYGDPRAFASYSTTPEGVPSPSLAMALPYRPVFTVGPKSLLPVRILNNIQQPSGVTTDPNGNIFVASTREKTISVYGFADTQPCFKISEVQNPSDPRNKRFSRLSGLAFTRDGYLLVSYEHRLVKMTQDGTVVAFFGNERNVRGKSDRELDSPGGIAIGTDDRIYLVDCGNHRIQVLGSNFQYITSLFNPDDKERKSEYLECAAVNSAGDLYVTDRRNCNVQVFNHSGKFLYTFGKSGSRAKYKRGQLSSPHAIAIDREDFVYVGGDDGLVSIFDKKGDFVRSFGGVGDEPGQFNKIQGMHIDVYGQLCVCDWKNNRVQVFQGQY